MNSEITDIKRKLDDLAKAIEQRERDLKERGVFSDVHAAYVRGLKAEQAQLAGRAASALDEPRLRWEGIRDELNRDYNSLVDELNRLVERLDTEQVKALFKNQFPNR